MKEQFLTLYNQLEPDNFEKVAEIENIKMCLLDFGHRIPGILMITKDSETFGSFTSLLNFASLIIDNEPGETICCDTDMDSYNIIPILDWEHSIYGLPDNPLIKTGESETMIINGWDIYGPYIALIIQPLDYHS